MKVTIADRELDSLIMDPFGSGGQGIARRYNFYGQGPYGLLDIIEWAVVTDMGIF